jgi:hypothetical protein
MGVTKDEQRINLKTEVGFKTQRRGGAEGAEEEQKIIRLGG